MDTDTINFNDPCMEYAYRFASLIDPIYEEDWKRDSNGNYVSIIGENGRPIYQKELIQTNIGDKLNIFINRLDNGEIITHFDLIKSKRAHEIRQTLSAYNVNIEKFGYALLFIYDMVTSNMYDRAISTSEFDAYNVVKSYMDNHPQFTIYLSDGDVAKQHNRCEIVDLSIIRGFKCLISQNLNFYKNDQDVLCFTKFDSDICLKHTLTETKMVYDMYHLLHKLLKMLKLPDRRTPKDSNVSMNKQLLISRLIYLCKITTNKKALRSSSYIKSVISKTELSYKTYSRTYGY